MIEQPSADDTRVDEELVAYLDGELDTEAARLIESRLTEDSTLRERLSQHQQTWDLLDELPKTEAGEDFAHTTVEMIAVSANEEVIQLEATTSWKRWAAWLAGGVAACLAALAGYSIVAAITHAPNRQLVEDLHIIEYLDAYRSAEDIQFLRALEREGLFVGEAEDAL